MKNIFKKIWKLALPYLRKGIQKDLVIHTEGVIKAMELLLEQENGDENILIPAAILHDVGWSRVPLELQKNNSEKDKIDALCLHIKYAPPIIEEILTKVGYNKSQIEKVINIVVAHKFQDPRELDKQLLIDADSMSDAFKKQFYSDVKSYPSTPQKKYEFRKRNKFYTKTAKELFNRELENRRKEFQSKQVL
jgi:hypothetical protein